jgi:hypothetical protein
MYRSKNLIEKRLGQIKYVFFKRIKKYEGKVFVYNGQDLDTKCYPIDVDYSNFVTLGRSIFQYALEEIGSNEESRRLYDSFIEGRPLLKFFKDIRDQEIHIGPGGHQTTIELQSRIRLGNEDSTDKLSKNKKEESKTPLIKYEIYQLVEPTEDAYLRFMKKGELDLADAIKNGIPLYEKLAFGGETDLFRLCEKYIKEIESFIQYGIEKGFIT